MFAIQLTINEAPEGSNYRPWKGRFGPFALYVYRGPWKAPVDIEDLQRRLTECEAAQEPPR